MMLLLLAHDMINDVLNIHPHTSSSSISLHLLDQLQSSEEREGFFLSWEGMRIHLINL